MAFFWLFFVFIIVAAFIATEEVRGKDILVVLLWGVLSIFFSYSWLCTPIYYVFSLKGVTIHYLFGYYKYYAWKSVSKITRKTTIHYKGGLSDRFLIEGKATGKEAFFTRRCNTVFVTEETQEMMRRFWNKRIDRY